MHLSVAAGAGVGVAVSPAGASVPVGVPAVDPAGFSDELTVVELTCRLPDDLRPLVDPVRCKSVTKILHRTSK